MSAPDRIVLVGFMGAGKTTVGKALAKRLRWAFVDLDRRIEERTGTDVPTLFRDRGESAFREEERLAAEDLAAQTACVVAAGGGAFAEPDTRAALQAGARTVWLQCDPAVLVRRIRPDGSRPLANNRERMLELLAKREPFYRLADLTVDTSSAGPTQVAQEIAERFGLSGGSR